MIIFGLGVFWGLQFGGLQILQFLATMPGADAELLKQYDDLVKSPDFNMNVEQALALSSRCVVADCRTS